MRRISTVMCFNIMWLCHNYCCWYSADIDIENPRFDVIVGSRTMKIIADRELDTAAALVPVGIAGRIYKVCWLDHGLKSDSFGYTPFLVLVFYDFYCNYCRIWHCFTSVARWEIGWRGLHLVDDHCYCLLFASCIRNWCLAFSHRCCYHLPPTPHPPPASQYLCPCHTAAFTHFPSPHSYPPPP